MQTQSLNNSVVVEPLTQRFKLRFDDEIIEPSYYRFELEALEQARQGDEVAITTNSNGGSLATGIEMTNAIVNCKAGVHGILRSSCHSCGSIIFLACTTHEVGIASEMLLHSGSGGNYGTPSQSIQRAESYKRQVRSLFETVYLGFLSEEELSLMIDHDKDFIFCGEEIEERLQRMYKYREGSYKEAMNQMFDQQIAAEDEALDAGLNHLLTSGKVTQAEVDAIKKITPLLDEAFESGEIDLDNLPKSVETSEEESSDYSNAFTIKVKDEIAAICMYTLDEDGVITEAVLDIAEYDDEVVVSNIWLEDNLDRSELITLAKDIGVKSVAHNTKDVNVIINKIINYVDCLIEKEENS